MLKTYLLHEQPLTYSPYYPLSQLMSDHIDPKQVLLKYPAQREDDDQISNNSEFEDTHYEPFIANDSLTTYFLDDTVGGSNTLLVDLISEYERELETDMTIVDDRNLGKGVVEPTCEATYEAIEEKPEEPAEFLVTLNIPNRDIKHTHRAKKLARRKRKLACVRKLKAASPKPEIISHALRQGPQRRFISCHRKLSFRSKIGCWVCRLKHKKCDESVPSCSNCFKQHIQCDYSPERPLYITDDRARLQKLNEVNEIWLSRYKLRNLLEGKNITLGKFVRNPSYDEQTRGEIARILKSRE